MREELISMLFPRRCPVCDGIVSPKGKLVCNTCKVKLPYINGARCRKCSKPVECDDEYCYDCSRIKHLYREGIGMFEHKGVIRHTIYSIKYNNKREYVDMFCKELFDNYEKLIRGWDADAIIPVPLHRKKEITRGFNQAEIFGNGLNRVFNIPVYDDILVRARHTTPQKELSDKERRKNVENAFKINKNIVKLNKIIVVDDIYTTGSTIDACAEVLIKAGVEKVYFITMSIGDGL